MSDIEGLRPELLTTGRPSAHGIVRGGEHERLDVSALSRGAYAAPPVPRVQIPADENSLLAAPGVAFDDEPYVLPRKRMPWRAALLLLGFGASAGLGAALFAALSERGVEASHAAVAVGGAAPAAAAAAPAAPAAPVQESASAFAPAPLPPAAIAAAEPAAFAATGAEPSHAAPATAAVAVRGVTRSEPRAPASLGPPPRAPSFATSDESEPEPPAADAPSTPVLIMRPVAEPEPEPPPAPAAEPASRKRGSLDALLDDALTPAARRAELAREPEPQARSSQLPVTPSRSEVAQAMNGVQTAIRGCAMGQTGVAHAALIVRNDGSVASAEVTSAPFAGTASGRCMEGALRRVHFPRFRQPLFNVRYPFSIE